MFTTIQSAKHHIPCGNRKFFKACITDEAKNSSKQRNKTSLTETVDPNNALYKKNITIGNFNKLVTDQPQKQGSQIMATSSHLEWFTPQRLKLPHTFQFQVPHYTLLKSEYV